MIARSILRESEGSSSNQRAKLDDLLERATTNEPTERPGSALAFADELVALAGAIEAGPAPLAQQPAALTTPGAIAETTNRVNLRLVAAGLGVVGLVLVVLGLLLLGSG